MIVIDNRTLRSTDLDYEIADSSIERKIVNILSSSRHKYYYDSINQLKFELKLRDEIIKASYDLNQSGLHFAIFRRTKCNPYYWNRAQNGGFVLKNNVRASDAINDIYDNGHRYATECATGMMIVYYKALLEVYSARLFDRVFKDITLMNWHQIDPLLYEVGKIYRRYDYLPGDRRYFKNPDVSPLTPQWQGENVIDLGNGLYYGHGIGIHDADEIVHSLNRHRSEGADESAFLLDSAGRPNFKKLEEVYGSYYY